VKFSANKEAFSDAFASCAVAVNSRSPKEILQNVHIKVSDGAALLSATDTETSVIVEAKVESQVVGEALLPPDRVLAIMKETVGDDISFESEGGAVRVSSGSASYNIPTANPDEFPKPKLLEGASAVSVPVAALQAAIKQSSFATDPASSRYALGGVKIERDGDNLAMVGTDGRRLSRIHFADVASDFDCILPVHAANIVQRSKFSDEATAEISHDTNNFQMKCESYIVISRLVEGRYPNWKQVIPAHIGEMNRAAITASSLNQAIRQAAIVADQESRGINFTFEQGALSLSSQAASRGSARIKTDLEYSGDALTTKLDYKFVSDFVRSIDQDSLISIFFRKENESVVIDDGKGGIYVVMPMALDR